MPLTNTETAGLLAVKGVGKTVLQRLQQMGLDDVAKLAAANPADILQQGAAITGSSCWKNSRKPKPPSPPPWLERRHSKVIRQPETKFKPQSKQPFQAAANTPTMKRRRLVAQSAI